MRRDEKQQRAVDGSSGRSRTWRWGSAVAALLAISVVLAACGGGSSGGSGGSSSTSGGEKPVLTIGLTNDASTLNPATEPAGSSAPPFMSTLAYASLTHMEPDGKIVPGLATKWRYLGKENKEFELTLREDAKFSDGTPVDGAAVATWLEYFVNAGGDAAENLGLESAKAVGRYKVLLKLASPNPIVPYLLSEILNAGFVASPKAVAKPKTLATETFGAGPYVVDPSESVAGDHFVFVPNKYYYEPEAIRFSKVVVKIIPQASSILAAIQSGQINVAMGDVSTAGGAKSAGLEVIGKPYGWGGILIFDRGPELPNGERPNPLEDVRVRKALNYALDRKTISESLLGEYATPTSQAPTADGTDPSLTDYYPYDPEKAKQLMKEAGYANGFTLDIFSQSYIGTLGDPMVQAVAKYWSAIGVKVNLHRANSGTDYVDGILSGDYSGTGISQSPLLPMFQFYNYYLGPKSILNQHGWDNPEIDKLYEEGSVASQDEAGKYWQAISKILVEEAIQLPVVENDSVWFTDGSVTGLEYNAVRGLPYPTEWVPAG